MRVVVWNMGHWTKSADQATAAWERLDALQPDIALLQEAAPPEGRADVVYRPIGGSRTWGSAVVGYGVPLTEVTHAQGRYAEQPVPLAGTVPGSVAVAAATMGGREYTFVSMYGVIDGGYADTTVNRHLSDLVPLLDSPQHEGGIALGGDLNITTQWSGKDARYREWEMATFARIRAFGLMDLCDISRPAGRLEGCDCPDGDDCRHTRTQYHPRSEKPWQNDYAFASVELVDTGVFQSAAVLDQAPWASPGKHLPLVLEFSG